MISLPASIQTVHNQIVIPALQELPTKMFSLCAVTQLLATGGQESGYMTRLQLGNGPAHGLWQYETSGVSAVLKNPKSHGYLVGYLQSQTTILVSAENIYQTIATDDITACVVARLMYWTDPHPLPKFNDEEGAWQYYLRNWRPGKPNRLRWAHWYQQTVKYLKDE